MQYYLNNHQIEYVFYHLSFFIDFKKIKGKIRFIKSDKTEENESQIIFFLSENKIDEAEIFFINDIPILFPLNKEKHFYYFEKNNLFFNHDIFKSVFYLLSGYQEFEIEQKDNLGRFPYNDSIQKKLSIIDKPIVNYYFQIISEAFLEFGQKNNISVEKKQIFTAPLLLLSHDVDRIKTSYLSEIPFKIKQFLNLKPSRLSKKELFILIFKYITKFNKKIWSFDWLMQLEIDLNIRSAFYFLDNHGKKDSTYSLKEDKTVRTISKLHENGFEIGIHGTFDSYIDKNELLRIKNDLHEVTNRKQLGIRQHYLRCEIPLTQKLQQETGYTYDTTVGFAEHEGFRNSFCHPLKLYDFENDKMLEIWEIPLVIMDGTLFEYRELNFGQAKKSVECLSDEIKKFNGVLSVLWHNDFFDEVLHKGITVFFKSVLASTLNLGFENKLGLEAIQIIEEKLKNND